MCVLTQTVSQEVRGETLGSVAHGCVVVRVSSKHQHGSTHYHRRVKVTEKATVSEDSPVETDSNTDEAAQTLNILKRLQQTRTAER